MVEDFSIRSHAGASSGGKAFPLLGCLACLSGWGPKGRGQYKSSTRAVDAISIGSSKAHRAQHTGEVSLVLLSPE